MFRNAILWTAILVAIAALVILAATTAFWILIGGTVRGEMTLGTVVQIGLAILSCGGLESRIIGLGARPGP